MPRKCKFLFSLILLLAGAGVVSSQTLTAAGLNKFLDKAELATNKYTTTFKNLSAEELKINKYFRDDGTIESTHVVKSLFIVYQSPRGNISEFRNVTEFNDKPVARDDEKIADFFTKLEKVNSDSDEARKIIGEGTRYDGKIISWGITLNQENPFGEFRPFFEFKIIGTEKIEGHDTIIIGYRQIAPTLLVKANPTADELRKEPRGRTYNTDLPNKLRPTDPRMFGKIWLDAKDASIWRNEFKISLNPKRLSQPVVSLESFYEFQPSKFGILVPKKFQIINYKLRGTTDKDLKVTKYADRTFEYSKFEEFTTEINKAETDNHK